MFFIISVPTTNYKNAQKVCIPLKSCAAINKEKAPRSDAPGGFGPSGATRTRGFHIPNVAPYQLGYTRIFNFYHYTTAEGKIKDFSVCGHSCGQIRFCAVFGNRGESRKRRCRKALRRFALPCPGYRHGTPKASALPTALIPDMKFRLIRRPDVLTQECVCKWLRHRTRPQYTWLAAKGRNADERLSSILLKSAAKSSPI